MLSQDDQNRWMFDHIPYRVRVAISRLNDLDDSILGVKAFIKEPVPESQEQAVYRRCETDAIWEGRLTAIRWLIEFVGVKQRRKDGKAIRCDVDQKEGSDVRITHIQGGIFFDLTKEAEAQRLANIWKGCTQASSHATNANHLPVDDKTAAEALKIVLRHLQETIYAGKNLGDYVLTTDPPEKWLGQPR